MSDAPTYFHLDSADCKARPSLYAPSPMHRKCSIDLSTMGKQLLQPVRQSHQHVLHKAAKHTHVDLMTTNLLFTVQQQLSIRLPACICFLQHGSGGGPYTPLHLAARGGRHSERPHLEYLKIMDVLLAHVADPYACHPDVRAKVSA